MKKSAIGGGIAAVVIIGIVVALAYNPQENGDGLEIPVEESPNISDSANVSEGADFIIDEEGNKVYIISVGDKPDLDD